MIKYGLISDTDARCLEKTIDLIDDKHIEVTEVGCYSGETSRGLSEYIKSKQKTPIMTGIDNGKDKELVRFGYHYFIDGDSNEVYHRLKDNSQHLIFVDGCHCFAHVISDFFCYAPKVKVGGYFAFHDTGKHIQPFKDFQHGDNDNPDAYISARRALANIGLLYEENQYLAHLVSKYKWNQWELIFDEADETNEAGGICVFKKLY